MNKIEHRLFSFITINWRGKPLSSLETIINLIAGTTSGLKVYARLGERPIPTRSASPTASWPPSGSNHAFHPDWNYTIKPRVIV